MKLSSECVFVFLIIDKFTVFVHCFRYGGYDSPGWGHGVRNIVLSSLDPSAGLETWIRFENGETRAKVTLDKYYGR
jgi:hypothetical protein